MQKLYGTSKLLVLEMSGFELAKPLSTFTINPQKAFGAERLTCPGNFEPIETFVCAKTCSLAYRFQMQYWALDFHAPVSEACVCEPVRLEIPRQTQCRIKVCGASFWCLKMYWEQFGCRVSCECSKLLSLSIWNWHHERPFNNSCNNRVIDKID